MGRAVFPGGKGLNQSVALANAVNGYGVQVYHAGGIGRSDGVFLKKLLSEACVDVRFIAEYDIPTGHAVIQVDSSGQNCIVLYGGANLIQDNAYIDSVLSYFNTGDYLLLQNEISADKYLIEKAHSKGMTVFLNPSPFNGNIRLLPLNFVDCFLVNEIEAAALCGEKSNSSDEMIKALGRKFPKAKFVLTLGKSGVVYKDGGEIYKHGIYDVPVVDTTAAGDTFSGFFIGCLARGISIKDSLLFASKASSIAVSRKGAAPSIPDFKEVEKAQLKQIE